MCVVQIDYDDSFNDARVNLMGIAAWPTVVSMGVLDAWPISCLEDDLLVQLAVPSPMEIFITEQGIGVFQVEVVAESDIAGAYLNVAVTLAEEVPSSSGMSFLPRHVKLFLTPAESGDPFALGGGESWSGTFTFEVPGDWTYEDMGVAAWVSQPGGQGSSPSCNQGFTISPNEVLQSRWVACGGPVGTEDVSWGSLKGMYR